MTFSTFEIPYLLLILNQMSLYQQVNVVQYDSTSFAQPMKVFISIVLRDGMQTDLILLTRISICNIMSIYDILVSKSEIQTTLSYC